MSISENYTVKNIASIPLLKRMAQSVFDKIRPQLNSMSNEDLKSGLLEDTIMDSVIDEVGNNSGSRGYLDSPELLIPLLKKEYPNIDDTIIYQSVADEVEDLVDKYIKVNDYDKWRSHFYGDYYTSFRGKDPVEIARSNGTPDDEIPELYHATILNNAFKNLENIIKGEALKKGRKDIDDETLYKMCAAAVDDSVGSGELDDNTEKDLIDNLVAKAESNPAIFDKYGVMFTTEIPYEELASDNDEYIPYYKYNKDKNMSKEKETYDKDAAYANALQYACEDLDLYLLNIIKENDKGKYILDSDFDSTVAGVIDDVFGEEEYKELQNDKDTYYKLFDELVEHGLDQADKYGVPVIEDDDLKDSSVNEKVDIDALQEESMNDTLDQQEKFKKAGHPALKNTVVDKKNKRIITNHVNDFSNDLYDNAALAYLEKYHPDMNYAQWRTKIANNELPGEIAKYNNWLAEEGNDLFHDYAFARDDYPDETFDRDKDFTIRTEEFANKHGAPDDNGHKDYYSDRTLKNIINTLDGRLL